MITFEYTDTFSGEANYSWVKRHTITGQDWSLSVAKVIRRAKSWAGLTGCRCAKSDMGDYIELRPSGSCTVLFITWEPDTESI